MSSTTSMKVTGLGPRLMVYGGAYSLSIATLFPIYYMINTALKTEGQYGRSPFGLATKPTFSNLSTAWSTGGLGLDSDLFHSGVVAIGGTALCVAVATLAGYGLSQMRPKIRRRLLLPIVSFMMITPPVLIVPLYLTMIRFGLENTFLGAILAYAALFTPFAVYLTTAFFGEVSKEVLEAARCDGAGPLQRFRHVVLPMGRPAVTTLGVLLFLWIWNDLLFALFLLQGSAVRTAMVSIAQLIGNYNVPETGLTAGLLIALLPPAVVFLLFQSKVERGLTLGAGK